MKNLGNKYQGDTGYGECGTGGNFSLAAAVSPPESAKTKGREPAGKIPELAALKWSGRQDSNLRPPGPEGAPNESHGVSAAGIGSQPVETIQEQHAPSLDPVAENALVETQFGAPVVRELSPDPGPHERLMTVRAVADRLGVCPALVYRLCRRGELSSLRIGGSLRFQLEAVDGYLAKLVGAHGNDRPKSPPGGEGADATEDG